MQSQLSTSLGPSPDAEVDLMGLAVWRWHEVVMYALITYYVRWHPSGFPVVRYVEVPS